MSEADIAFASGQLSKGRCALYSNEDAVKIVSTHSSEGFEFGMVVLVPCLSDMPKKGEDEANRRVYFTWP